MSKLQTYIALSTLYSKYAALSYSVRELLPLKIIINKVIENFGVDCEKLMSVSSSTVYAYNNQAIVVSKSTRMTPTSNQISVKYHWFRQHVGK